MPVLQTGDPRLQALFGASDPREAGVRPTVRLPRKGLPPLALAAIAVTLAVILFMVLDGRRTQQPEPAIAVQRSDGASTSWAPPPLYVPPVVAPYAPVIIERPEAGSAIAPTMIAPQPQTTRPRIIYQPQPAPQTFVPPPPAVQPRVSSGAPLVIDNEQPKTGDAGAGGVTAFNRSASPGAQSRMRSSTFANRSMTVPQGHLIPAVLETGFDSTEPGFARAIVSRDVRGFDGSRILIPRGSRLVGQYRSDVAQGQRRAVIAWTRLIRPDGMTILLDSPAVDTLGRGGVAASVNTHFFQRFGDALLQSTVEIGRAFAGTVGRNPLIVVPANGVAATQVSSGSSWTPTLTVPAGKSISVFVAHDLDFGAEPAAQ